MICSFSFSNVLHCAPSFRSGLFYSIFVGMKTDLIHIPDDCVYLRHEADWLKHSRGMYRKRQQVAMQSPDQYPAWVRSAYIIGQDEDITLYTSVVMQFFYPAQPPKLPAL